MTVIITGLCGFVGSVLALELKRSIEGLEIIGLDNLSRPGSERNRGLFRQHGIRLVHGDIRNASDLEALPRADWVIDAAANPSVTAGVTDQTSSRQVMEHNLVGTLNVLEYCKRHGAGIIVLSTSRVYSLEALCKLPLDVKDEAFIARLGQSAQPGISSRGIDESFSTQPPLSLYGSAKLASEILALEYGAAFNLPVQVNRCGVLAGAGQFGKPDQGIFSFWIHSYRARRPLRYIGFGGTGHQVRDCLHPRDLAALIALQMRHPGQGDRVMNVSGGAANSISLAQLSRWCAGRFGAHTVERAPEGRPFDVPWLVLDSSRAAQCKWLPTMGLEAIIEEIARHAEANPDWLDVSNGP